MNEFNEHPGVADGTKSDLDILARSAAKCEAGDQGIAGMKAVALVYFEQNHLKGGDFPSRGSLCYLSGHYVPPVFCSNQWKPAEKAEWSV